MHRPPSCNYDSANNDIRASPEAHESTNHGVVVPLFAYDRGDLLGEAFVRLGEMNAPQLARWVSAMRSGRVP